MFSVASKELIRGLARRSPKHAAAALATSMSTVSEANQQLKLWDRFLASGRGGRELFRSIDTDDDSNIASWEVKDFLDTVPHDGEIKEAAFAALQSLADDHTLDEREFLRWLVAATKFSGCTPNFHQDSYEGHIRDRSEPKDDSRYTWNDATMSQSLRRMQYAVRGEVVMKAEALQAEGRDVIYTNIGNPHGVGQAPITYYRQMLALCDLPAECGVDHPDADKIFPKDVLERAREYRDAIGPCGTGAYTHSQGVAKFRQHVADFISDRDGHPSYPGNIFLTDGASSGIKHVLTGLIANDDDAIMIPIPQYPIYSALIALLGGRQVGYELEESIGWAVTEEELQKRLIESQTKGLDVRAMAIINPGNPTGQVLSREALVTICKFCADNGIVLLADEVYQRNVYVPDKEFISAKKIAVETPGCEDLQLVSFHSTSKGLIGECGRRGGYMELHNIEGYVQSQLYKLASSGLCSGVAGQVMMSLMVNPPKPGDESYDLFHREETAIFDSLKRRAKALVEGLNKIDGITCEPAEGAMYAFPAVEIPTKAVEDATSKNMRPDTLYALSLLDETGICVVPASGFGQRKGRHGFRTTFLPPEDVLMGAIGEFGRHHRLFCDRYA